MLHEADLASSRLGIFFMKHLACELRLMDWQTYVKEVDPDLPEWLSLKPEIMLSMLTYVTRPGLLLNYDKDHIRYGNELSSLTPHFDHLLFFYH
jgi:hypothetical protein